MHAPTVIRPPVPTARYPNVGPDDVGPVGPPLHVSLADIGPVGDFPDMPDWLIKEAKLKAPTVNTPAMPKNIRNEARDGVKVKPQPSDYVAPPVTTPRDPVTMNQVMPGPTDSEMRDMVMVSIQPRFEPDEFSKDIQAKDFMMGNLLKGTSRHAAGLGQTQGRTLGEGI